MPVRVILVGRNQESTFYVVRIDRDCPQSACVASARRAGASFRLGPRSRPVLRAEALGHARYLEAGRVPAANTKRRLLDFSVCRR